MNNQRNHAGSMQSSSSSSLSSIHSQKPIYNLTASQKAEAKSAQEFMTAHITAVTAMGEDTMRRLQSHRPSIESVNQSSSRRGSFEINNGVANNSRNNSIHIQRKNSESEDNVV
jgi:hypothetical protein